jgi:hypothetical protein
VSKHDMMVKKITLMLQRKKMILTKTSLILLREKMILNDTDENFLYVGGKKEYAN